MFHKKEKAQKQDIPQIPPEMTEKIRTMPDKFYSSSGKKSGHKLFILLVLILVVLGAAIVGVLFFAMRAGTPDIPSDIVPDIHPTAVPSPTASPQAQDNNPVNSEDAQETPDIPSDFTVDTSDIDSDNLSGEEERLFGTNSNSPDTDSDGYNDYNELLTGYDPRLSGKTLNESGLVSSYTLLQNASILYPASWFARTEDTRVIFDSKKGDMVSVSSFNNQENIEPMDWIEKFDSDTLLQNVVSADLANASLGSAVAYKTQDNLKYYIFSKTSAQVFIILYRPGIPGVTPFSGTFLFMVNSLKIS